MLHLPFGQGWQATSSTDIGFLHFLQKSIPSGLNKIYF